MYHGFPEIIKTGFCPLRKIYLIRTYFFLGLLQVVMISWLLENAKSQTGQLPHETFAQAGFAASCVAGFISKNLPFIVNAVGAQQAGRPLVFMTTPSFRNVTSSEESAKAAFQLL
jgi:hypothetical protein